MYKLINDSNKYDNYYYVETKLFQKCNFDGLNSNPKTYKLFSNDVFDYNIDRNDVVIRHSNFRSNKYNAGILYLNQTHGKYKNKLLYLCKPDDKRIPFFLIPYNQTYKFDKSVKQVYITFEFLNWDQKHPYGIVTQNFGDVRLLNNFYEYILYCKSLNVSIQQFTKKAKQKLSNISNEQIIQEITRKYNIQQVDRESRFIFTIDSRKSNDFDDAISYNPELGLVSVYITNVAVILDYLGLWSSFTNRISSIYLPDKKRTMLPQILVDNLCSLKEKQNKICFVLDMFYANKEIVDTKISMKSVYISKNYCYEDYKCVGKNKHIDGLMNLLSVTTSAEVITKLMMQTNNIIAKVLAGFQRGIFKSLYQECHDTSQKGAEALPLHIRNHIKIIKNKASNYSLFGSHVYKSLVHRDMDIYLQITSPIRRLVDIVNNIALLECLGLYCFSEAGKEFYNEWTSVEKMNYINTSSRAIRKIQSKCKIYAIHEENQRLHNGEPSYEGYLFDKILKEGDGKYQYMVYLPKLQLTTYVTLCEELENYSKHYFSIYIFMNEINDKKKIKLQICYNQ